MREPSLSVDALGSRTMADASDLTFSTAPIQKQLAFDTGEFPDSQKYGL
jgi:hypothetical protein